MAPSPDNAKAPQPKRQPAPLRTKSAHGSGQTTNSASLAKLLTESASSLLNTAFTASSIDFCTLGYGEFISSVDHAGCCWMLHSDSGVIWLELSQQIAIVVSDRLLGGDGAAGESRHSPTRIERSILTRFVEMVAECITRILPMPVTLEAAPNTQLRMPDETVAVVSIAVVADGCDGMIRLCLTENIGRMLAEARQNQSHSQRVTISAATAEARISKDQLGHLSMGDVLVTDTEAEGELEVLVDGKATFAGALASHNGRKVVRITRVLDEH